VFALVLRHRGWARASRVRCTVGHRCHRLCACYCIVPTVEMFLTANPPLAPAFHLVQPTLGQVWEKWDGLSSKMTGKNALEALLASMPSLQLCLPNNNSPMKSTVSCLFKTHCVNNLFWGLGGGCVIMKETQCSEAESTANHPAFSAPGLTRHRAACCVVALAFLLSNPRWLSNICFQIGIRLQIFAFKSAASPQSSSHVSTWL